MRGAMQGDGGLKGARKIDGSINIRRRPSNARSQPEGAKKMMDRLNTISEEYAWATADTLLERKIIF